MALTPAVAVLLTVASASSAPASRETVNFDFAFRFKLDVAPPPPPLPPPGPPSPHHHPPGPPPPPVPPGQLPKRLTTCQHCQNNTNCGTGSIKSIHVGQYADCCDACAHTGGCESWDWNPEGGNCYLKDNVDGGCKTTGAGEQRWSGTMPKGGAKTAQDYIAESAVGRADDQQVIQKPPPPPHSGPGPNAPQAQTKYDDSTWSLVDAPHDMLINQKYDGRNSKSMAYLPRNSGWYRKHFALPAEWKGKSVWLYIEGSFHKTFSYLNGVSLGSHQAGYTSFWLRLDNVTGVQYGSGSKNVLALYVDASFGTGWCVMCTSPTPKPSSTCRNLNPRAPPGGTKAAV